ncbi:MAG: two-component system response regulator HydG, partial [Candidatus Omnitrophota bacterium]
EKKKLVRENKRLKEFIKKENRGCYGEMIGSSDKMQRIYHVIDSVASTNATILISGESGTGKGLIAREIHGADQNRKDKPFVEISCGALSETLLESELFGHVKGSFTGAIKDKEGRFEFARGGTIFLDEIDAFSLSLQVKLLRVLQNGEFECVGDNVTRRTNARIIVATNKNLMDLIDKGEFREDLYYRINVIAIQTPPLRERDDDISPIVDYYIKKYSEASKKNVKGVSSEVNKMFANYRWPGNIRELENVIEGAIIMTQGETVEKNDIPHVSKFDDIDSFSKTKVISKGGVADDKTLKKMVEEPEKDHIINVLKGCQWNRNKAASVLGINRTTLYNKMKKYNISEKN